VVAKSGDARGQVRLGFLASSAGIILSFMLLAGAAIGVKAAGLSVGWGIQFQQPVFLAFMIALLVLFTCNLLGLFDFRLPGSLGDRAAGAAGRSGYFGDFLTGAFATLLATPCSAPFLGTAVGFALSHGPFEILAVFTALGLGLAAPYLAVALFPQAIALMPKPGPWMETFKQSMGFLLMAALVFLVYLLGQLAGLDAITTMLVVLLVAAIAAWIYGRWGAPVKSAKTQGVARLVAVLLLLLSLIWGLLAVDAAYDASAGEATSEVAEGWARWSPEAVERAIAADKPVFVDFTATWCLICQVNKKTALHTEATRELFEDYGVVSLVADWTRRDPAITDELEKFGRSGVPLYLLYSPEGEVTVLPQNLTNGMIREAVEALKL
jgi:thiol:disulfide interchange protein